MNEIWFMYTMIFENYVQHNLLISVSQLKASSGDGVTNEIFFVAVSTTTVTSPSLVTPTTLLHLIVPFVEEDSIPTHDSVLESKVKVTFSPVSVNAIEQQ
jgi:hypothetical protein